MLRVLLLLTLSFYLASCLRYVPSRNELQKQRGRLKDGEKTVQLGGPAEFKEHERRLSERLTKLLSDRERLVSADGQAEYFIGAGDVLEMQVFGLAELNATAEVSTDGTVSLPLIGPVSAQGLSLAELRTKITGEMAEYVRSPRIQLSIKEYASHKVSVIGAVAKPGTYPLKREGQTLTELLSLAGGRTDRSSTRMILIPGRRTVDSQSPAQTPNELPLSVAAKSVSVTEDPFGVEIDIDDLSGSVDRRPIVVPLLPGDTIVVPETGSFKVDGEVVRPGSFPLTARTSTLGAVAAAGGFTYSADVNEVEVIRDIGAGKKASMVLDMEQVALSGAQDIPLRDGDVVRIPSEPGRFRTRQVVEVLNGFFKAGISGSVKP